MHSVHPTRFTNTRKEKTIRFLQKIVFSFRRVNMLQGTHPLSANGDRDRCEFRTLLRDSGCIIRCGFVSVPTRIGEHDLCRKRQLACELRRRTSKAGFASNLARTKLRSDRPQNARENPRNRLKSAPICLTSCTRKCASQVIKIEAKAT